MIVSRKYNQRTKEWNSKVVKVKKKYEYIAMLMARIMRMRKDDAYKVTRNVPLNESTQHYLHQPLLQSHPHLLKNFIRSKKVGSKIVMLLEVLKLKHQLICEVANGLVK